MAERVDMSPEAVLRRLREVAQLYRLGKALAEAKLLGPVVVEGSRPRRSEGEATEGGDDG